MKIVVLGAGAWGTGFPPVHLAEINFQAMYEQQQAQAAGEPSPIITQ